MDYFYAFLGIIGAILTGQGWAANSVLFGKIVDYFLDFETFRDAIREGIEIPSHPNMTFEQNEDLLMDRIWEMTFISIALSTAFSIGNYLTIYYFQKFSLRQIEIIMKKYFGQILKQEIAWFDQQNSGEFASRISGDLKKFEHGINENFGIFLYNLAGVFINLIASFFYGWQLSLAIMAITPLIIVGSLLMTKVCFFLRFC